MHKIAQYLSYPIIRGLSRLYFIVEFENPEKLALAHKKPVIIIANHISYFDTFLLRLNSHSVGLSLHFMGARQFRSPVMQVLWWIGFIPLVYILFGVFVVVKGRGLEKNLEKPVTFISRNEQVFIFPEGSVNRTGVLSPFKVGAATLASRTGAFVLPIGYKRIAGDGTKDRIHITIGDMIEVQKGEDVSELNQKLFSAVQKIVQ